MSGAIDLGSVAASVELRTAALKSGVRDALSQIRSLGGGMKSQMSGLASDVDTQMKRAATSTKTHLKEMANAMEAEVGSFAGQSVKLSDAMIAAGTAGIAGLMRMAAAGNELQTHMIQVGNNVNMTGAQIADMKRRIEDLGADSPAELGKLADGFMHAENMGFNAAQSTQILDAAMKSAVSTGGDVADTTNVLANVMHEFGIQTTFAEHAMDALHVAAAEGNMTLEQLTTAGGPAFAMAASLGGKFTDTAAAISALTRHGFDAAEASTQVKDLYAHLSNPTNPQGLDMMGKAANVDLVHDFSPAGIKDRGLPGILEDVTKATKGDPAKIMAQLTDGVKVSSKELKQYSKMVGVDLVGAMKGGKLSEEQYRQATAALTEASANASGEQLKMFNAIRGGLGVMILCGQGAKDYHDILEDVNRAMAGELPASAEGYNRILETQGAATQILKNRMAILSDHIAVALLPMMKELTSVIGGVVKWFTSLPQWVQKAAVDTALFASVTLLVTGGLAKIVTMLVELGPALKVVTGLFTAETGILGAFRVAVLGVFEGLATLGAIIFELAGGWIPTLIGAVALLIVGWSRDWGHIREVTASVLEWMRPYVHAAWEWLKTEFTAGAAWLSDTWHRVWTGLMDTLSGWGNAAKEAGGRFMKGVADGIRQFMREPAQAMAEWMGDSMDALKNWATGASRTISDGVTNGVIDGLKKGGQAVSDYLNNPTAQENARGMADIHSDPSDADRAAKAEAAGPGLDDLMKMPLKTAGNLRAAFDAANEAMTANRVNLDGYKDALANIAAHAKAGAPILKELADAMKEGVPHAPGGATKPNPYKNHQVRLGVKPKKTTADKDAKDRADAEEEISETYWKTYLGEIGRKAKENAKKIKEWKDAGVNSSDLGLGTEALAQQLRDATKKLVQDAVLDAEDASAAALDSGTPNGRATATAAKVHRLKVEKGRAEDDAGSPEAAAARAKEYEAKIAAVKRQAHLDEIGQDEQHMKKLFDLRAISSADYVSFLRKDLSNYAAYSDEYLAKQQEIADAEKEGAARTADDIEKAHARGQVSSLGMARELVEAVKGATAGSDSYYDLVERLGQAVGTLGQEQRQAWEDGAVSEEDALHPLEEMRLTLAQLGLSGTTAAKDLVRGMHDLHRAAADAADEVRKMLADIDATAASAAGDRIGAQFIQSAEKLKEEIQKINDLEDTGKLTPAQASNARTQVRSANSNDNQAFEVSEQLRVSRLREEAAARDVELNRLSTASYVRELSNQYAALVEFQSKHQNLTKEQSQEVDAALDDYTRKLKQVQADEAQRMQEVARPLTSALEGAANQGIDKWTRGIESKWHGTIGQIFGKLFSDMLKDALTKAMQEAFVSAAGKKLFGAIMGGIGGGGGGKGASGANPQGSASAALLKAAAAQMVASQTHEAAAVVHGAAAATHATAAAAHGVAAGSEQVAALDLQGAAAGLGGGAGGLGGLGSLFSGPGGILAGLAGGFLISQIFSPSQSTPQAPVGYSQASQPTVNVNIGTVHHNGPADTTRLAGDIGWAVQNELKVRTS